MKEIVEGAGCELVYLPPYWPDSNPIEQAFSKVKGLLRKTEARTREALIEAMGRALWRRSRAVMYGRSLRTAVTDPWTNCYDIRSSAWNGASRKFAEIL